MPDFGSFIQGFTQTLNAKKDREQKREEMELQKKLLTAKITADDMEQKLKKTKLDAVMSLLGGQMPNAPASTNTIPPLIARPADTIPPLIARPTESSADSGLPSMVAQNATPQMQPGGGNVPRGTSPGGPSGVSGLMARPEGQIALHELFGFVPKSQTLTPRTIGGPNGGRVTQFFDESGNPVPGKSYPEPQDITTEEVNVGNQTFYRDIDKYTRQQVGELRPKQPGEVATEEVNVGNQTFYRDIDKYTRQQVGPLRSKQEGVKPLGATEANTIALTKSSLRDAQRGIDTLFGGNESKTNKLISSWLNLPGTTGREFSQSWDRASKPLMVALTGTGMSEREAEHIVNMSKPQPGDKDSAIKAKIESLVGFMQERLKLMDPTGDYGLVNIKLPWQQSAGSAKKPTLNMGTKGTGKLSPQDEAAAYMRGR